MLQNCYNVVIIWKWRVLSVHFLIANGEEYIFRENSAILVIFVSYILFFISGRILTVSIRDLLIGIFFFMEYLISLVRIRDLGWRRIGCGIWDPGSGIRDGKMSLTASGINMPDPQHFIK